MILLAIIVVVFAWGIEIYVNIKFAKVFEKELIKFNNLIKNLKEKNKFTTNQNNELNENKENENEQN